MRQLTDRERYLFDLQGYLVVEGLLTDDEVGRLNAAADANADRIEDAGEAMPESSPLGGTARRQYTGLLTWEKPWCDPFRELLAHPKVMPYLEALLGRGWHMDTEPVYFHYGKGAGGLKLHGGDPHFHSGSYYICQNGEMRNGLVVVQFTLSDQNTGDGGFCCIPGSHKANFVRPAGITQLEQDRGIVQNPTVRTGDVLIFSEQLTHGTLPWTAAHERRVLHYRFAPKCVQFGAGMHTIALPSWADELTEAQRATLEPAFYYGRPLVQPDGSVVRPLVDVQDPPFRYLDISDEAAAAMPSVEPDDPDATRLGAMKVVPQHAPSS